MKHSRKSTQRSPNASAAEPPADGFNALDKEDLHHLADRLLFDEPSTIVACIKFIEAETKGIWHGRARAMMCHRLKHCSLSSSQRERLVSCITERLCSGHFSEQFRDQLHLALHIDARRTFDIASACAHDHRDYIRRHAAWLLNIRTSRPPSLS